MTAIGDKFGKGSISTGYATATTVKTARVAGDPVLPTFDLSKFALDTPVFLVTYKKTTDPVTGIVSVTSQTSWKALVNPDNNTLTNLTLAPGYTDIGNEVGDFVECIPTSYWVNSLIDGLFVSMNPDGTLKTSAIKSALGNDGNLVQSLDDTLPDHVVSGGAWAVVSGLNASMSAMTAYVDGYKNTVAAIVSRSFTPSKDTYVDVLRNATTNAFSIVYTEVANGAASPALAANSKRLVRVTSSGSAITRIEHVGYDSLGNRFFNTVRMSPSVAFSNSLGSFGLNPTADDRTISGRWIKPYDIMTVGGTQVVRYQPFLRPAGTGNATFYRVSYIMRKAGAFVSLEPNSNTTVGQTANIQTLPYPVTDQTMDTYWATYDLAAYEQDAILRVELKRDGANVADVNTSFIEVEAMAIYYNKDYSKSA
jgi:hypothetical protein